METHADQQILYTNFYNYNTSQLYYATNYRNISPTRPTIFCLHGNSSIWRTFELFAICAIPHGIQVIAIDLPGCGNSSRLDNYSMQIIGNIISTFIGSFQIEPQFCNVFGHSLGGHLIAFLNGEFHLVILAGTPPLSSGADFNGRITGTETVCPFSPDNTAMDLIPFLSQETPFERNIATRFVSHTGVTGELLDDMIDNAIRTDGRFRLGCLSTLASIDQLDQLNTRESGSVIVFHAGLDGVINLRWLQTFIDSRVMFEGIVHQLPGSRHMSPHICANEILTIIIRAL